MEIKFTNDGKKVERKFIDGTADGNYALRILEAYRADCDLLYSDNTGGQESKNIVHVLMNEMQKQRAVELDIAIKHLKSLKLNSSEEKI